MFILDKIHAVAAADPGKLAVVYNGRPLSYGAFWRLIDACRRSLQPQLPTEGVAVISVGSILEGWIISLAVRGLGLDAAVTRSPDQLDVFAGVDVACVITLPSEQWLDAPAPAGTPRLRLSDPSAVKLDHDQPLPPPPRPKSPGGQIGLTSGTTGVSKMVLSNNGATEAPLAERAERYRALGEGFRPLGPETIANVFDFGLWTGAGVSWPTFIWSQGGAVSFHQGLDLDRSFGWPGITHAVATPAFLTVLAAAPEGAYPHLPDLQLIVVSGAVSPSLARAIRRRLTSHMLINLSSTEAGGWAHTLVESDEDLRWYRLDPGRRVEVVDDADRPLPPGELGRVRVAIREGRPTGYLGDAETTAKFFSGRWFYPGDLGVLDGKGRLALHGRTTDVVQVQGNKYPAEPWERAIQEALECEAVCIVSGSWRSEREQLHLFIENRRPVSSEALAKAVRATLSGFPGVHVHMVDALPRTETGKIRRIELAQQLHEGRYGQDA